MSVISLQELLLQAVGLTATHHNQLLLARQNTECVSDA